MENQDDVARELRKQWLVGRAKQIHDKLFETYRGLQGDAAPQRIQELIEAAEKATAPDPDVDPVHAKIVLLAQASAQASAESMLAAVAIYLAENER